MLVPHAATPTEDRMPGQGPDIMTDPAGMPPAVRDRPAKRVLDLVLALILLVPAAAVLLVLAVLVKLTSRGPVLYSQTRVGKNGRPYTLRKLRTMVHHSESLTGPRWSLPGDPRITRLGGFLRRTHLDELPQLWNVLCGHMSLIGPRPERPEFVPALAKAIHHYRERLAVRPGVTGLAQVQLPSDTTVESVRLKLAYDLWYAQNQTLWLDLRILLATGLKLCGFSFAALRGLLRFPARDRVTRAYDALGLDAQDRAEPEPAGGPADLLRHALCPGSPEAVATAATPGA
jgi:lipopolysaccharide/colanic/teichoic acid biosynthesis glycosyltransferase